MSNATGTDAKAKVDIDLLSLEQAKLASFAEGVEAARKRLTFLHGAETWDTDALKELLTPEAITARERERELVVLLAKRYQHNLECKKATSDITGSRCGKGLWNCSIMADLERQITKLKQTKT